MPQTHPVRSGMVLNTPTAHSSPNLALLPADQAVTHTNTWVILHPKHSTCHRIWRSEQWVKSSYSCCLGISMPRKPSHCPTSPLLQCFQLSWRLPGNISNSNSFFSFCFMFFQKVLEEKLRTIKEQCNIWFVHLWRQAGRKECPKSNSSLRTAWAAPTLPKAISETFNFSKSSFHTFWDVSSNLFCLAAAQVQTMLQGGGWLTGNWHWVSPS